MMGAYLSNTRSRAALLVFGVLLFVCAISASAGASSAAASVGWSVHVLAQPSVFSAHDEVECQATSASGPVLECDRFSIVALNVGDQPATGPVTLTLSISRGSILLGHYASRSGSGEEEREWGCGPGATSNVAVCTFEEPDEPIQPGRYLPSLNLPVTAPAGGEAGTEHAELKLEGGGAPQATVVGASAELNGPAPVFGVSEFAFQPEAAGGALESQAGAHPWALTTNLGTPEILTPEGSVGTQVYTSVESLKGVAVELPLGFLGLPHSAGQCTLAEIDNEPVEPGGVPNGALCPSSSRVGVFSLAGGIYSAEDGYTEEPNAAISGVYNMVPQKGYAAEFGITFAHGLYHVYMYASVVHTPAGYRVRVTVPDVPSPPNVTNAWLTFFGDPRKVNGEVTPESPAEPAFLTNPADCSSEAPPTERESDVELESWNTPGRVVGEKATGYPQLSGCGSLRFEPSLSLAPSKAGTEPTQEGTTQADSPSAYSVDLSVPQTHEFSELGTPPLRDATVTLPAGVSINPAAGEGLVGCQATGPEGINIGSGKIGAFGQDEGDPEATELGAGHPGGNSSPYDDGFYHVAPGHCPAASTLGTVEVRTPLLAEPLTGHVYLAAPRCGGAGQPGCTAASATNGELYGGYIEVAGSGVIIKIPGVVAADPVTGQVSASFTENPQFPFEDLQVHFHGGPRAPLANPQVCGSFATSSTLSSWAGNEVSGSSPAFDVTGCGASMGFAPGFVADMASPAASASSAFSLTLSRQDGEQDLSGLEATLPQGLLARISSVTQCPSSQAAAGQCPGSSEIGTVTATAGSGTSPLVETGHIYLTGPYNKGPFGEVVVVPAVAGPFNLGNVVVRGSIRINPATAQATVVSDPFPTIVDGVQLRVKTVNVSLKEGFAFNPTNCAQQQVTGRITAQQGASVNVATPFAATGCSNLPFKPGFSASTSGKTSKKDGASLTVKVTAPAGEANIHKVDLQLPKILPSRLSTLQKACTEAQFNANPAGCPEGSFIGAATAVTPILSAPLTGPAILVSHGGAAFPDVEFVLQGENGVEIVLDGGTQIKNGITYSHFETVPDAPISSFETVLPEGPHSVLGANGNLCATSTTRTVSVKKRVTVRVKGKARHETKTIKKTVTTPQSLVIPTTLVGQNGATVTQSTKVAVTGCGAVKKAGVKKTKKKVTKKKKTKK